jgi:nucleotide-binding universal stress UspA family protein
MPRPGGPSAETGAAVVHSAYRGLGLFGRLFEHTLGAATEYGFAGLPLEYEAEIAGSARKRTEESLTEEDRRLLSAKAAVVQHSTPAAAIVEYAATNHVDLIVVGTHGRGALGHLFMGSVAERVVRTAPCPVLAVRNPEHEFVLPDALVAVSHV